MVEIFPKGATVSFNLHLSRFSDLDRSLNRKRERFKVFEVESGSNRGRTRVELRSNRNDVIINLIIN